MRDVMKLVDSTKDKINPHYGMRFAEAVEISENSGSPLNAINTGFTLGYAQGMKAARAEMKKAGAAQ